MRVNQAESHGDKLLGREVAPGYAKGCAVTLEGWVCRRGCRSWLL